jgi:spore coat protein U-like protein
MAPVSRRRALLAALALGAAFAPAGARAQACTFSTGPTAMAFGAYSPASGAPADSTSTFSYDCRNASFRATVELSAGAGTFAQRQMSLGAERLAYNLYQDAARTIVWGDGTPPSRTLVGTRRRTTYTIYGRIPAGQWVAPGVYGDSITVTLLF